MARGLALLASARLPVAARRHGPGAHRSGCHRGPDGSGGIRGGFGSARLIADARAYNARLAATQVPSSIGETVEGDAVESSYASDTGYQRQLDGGDGVMATVRVPRIGVVLPVYHGTSSRVLDIGAGHVHGTSLPVGGRARGQSCPPTRTS